MELRQDLEINNIIGAGEDATFQILKHLTRLHPKSLKEFKSGSSGIYRQVPLEWVIPRKEFKLLSEAHQKGSIDLFILLNQKRVAIRVMGRGHGEYLKGLGKVKHDQVQAELIKQTCELVDIKRIECPSVFRERVTNTAIEEIKNSFKTFGVLIPVI